MKIKNTVTQDYCQLNNFFLLINTVFFYDVESPAAKTGLLVDDEILEVNGESVANLSHTEVILSIHKVGCNRCRASFCQGAYSSKITSPCTNRTVNQGSKKAKSGSPRQADFLARLVTFKVHLPNV